MEVAKMYRLLHLTGLMFLSALTSGDQPKIVIIGAGPSGIAAASKLFENGFRNVTILEAESRIGGRVYTTRFDDTWVDLGAQWVHGQNNNIAYELASPFGLLEIPPENTGYAFYFFDSHGNQVSTDVSERFIETFFYVEEKLDEDSNASHGSAGEYYTRVLTEEFSKYPSSNEALISELIKLTESLLNADDGSDSWYKTSVRGYEEYSTCEGNVKVNWKDRGYGTILDIVMKKYPNPEEELPVVKNTLFNSEVVNIDYSSTEGKAVVKTADGKEYVADHVITTPSLGVLKEQYQTLFTPQLPEYKVKTIRGLGFGAVAKIYLAYDTPWWPEDSPHFALIWESEDRQEYESDPSKKWLLDLNVFTLVSHKPRLLCGWVTGPGVRHMESLTEEQVFNQTLAHLNKFFGKSYRITQPSGMLRSQWHSNKHFRGSYSFRSMESERTNVWAEDLAAPLLVNDKPIVMFAGEASSPHHFSTVHGAIETGIREADRIIEFYKNKA